MKVSALILPAVIALLVIANAEARPAQVLLIRHGEKPSSGDELSDRGWERARALPALFHRSEFKGFGFPVALFAQDPKGENGSVRAIQTLKYVSEDLKLSIIEDYTREDFHPMVKRILNSREYDGKLVVICWEHKVLNNIAEALGAKDVPNYPESQFDRAWLITFGQGSTPSFKDLPERLLPGDDKN